MKTLLITFTLLITSLANAQVYIACTTDPAADEYILEFDGIEYGPFSPIEYIEEDNTTLLYDVEPLIVIETKHTIRLKALNTWGDESDWSVPFDFMLAGSPGAYTVISRKAPSAPVGVMLIIP